MAGQIIASVEEVKENEFLVREVNGKKVLLSLVNGQVSAIENRCPHLGLPLAKGKICDGVVVCPFHGSSFDLLTGDNIDWANAFFGKALPTWSHKLVAMGKKPAPVATVDVECVDGNIVLRES